MIGVYFVLFCLHFEMGMYHLKIANMILFMHSYKKWSLEADNNMQPRLSLHKKNKKKLSFIEVKNQSSGRGHTFFF